MAGGQHWCNPFGKQLRNIFMSCKTVIPIDLDLAPSM